MAKLKQYIGTSKLFALGFDFDRNTGRYILETTEFEPKMHRLKRRMIGWIKLDGRGYLTTQRGFPVNSEGFVAFKR